MPVQDHPALPAPPDAHDERLYSTALSGLATAEELTRRLESELATVRGQLTELAATARRRDTGPGDGRSLLPGALAEILYGEPAQLHCIEQLQREARKEVLGFTKPPYVMEGNPVQEERLAAGVAYRSLYESSALVHPGTVDLPGFIPVGEQARATPRVPMKLMIVDAEHALIPLAADRPGFTSGGLLLLHRSVLLDALLELFEERWLRGTPLRMSVDGMAEVDPESPDSPALDAQLLSLLLSGLPDKAIASQLGISLRTLQRRIRALMEQTGTANRTQLAWYVAQQRLA